MTNFTLKTAGLLIITLLSAQAFAKSPWAEETATNETSAADVQTEQVVEPDVSEPPMAETAPMTENPVAESINAPIEPEPVAVATEVEYRTTAPSTAEPVTTTSTRGDVLNTNNTYQGGSIRVIDFPRRGMTSDKVQNELGRPTEIIPSIGEPPISRWIYNDRTVYFEYSSVIHVVAK